MEVGSVLLRLFLETCCIGYFKTDHCRKNCFVRTLMPAYWQCFANGNGKPVNSLSDLFPFNRADKQHTSQPCWQAMPGRCRCWKWLSRLMCCSLVCKAILKARLFCASMLTPIIRPGIPRFEFIFRSKKQHVDRHIPMAHKALSWTDRYISAQFSGSSKHGEGPKGR